MLDDVVKDLDAQTVYREFRKPRAAVVLSVPWETHVPPWHVATSSHAFNAAEAAATSSLWAGTMPHLPDGSISKAIEKDLKPAKNTVFHLA